MDTTDTQQSEPNYLVGGSDAKPSQPTAAELELAGLLAKRAQMEERREVRAILTTEEKIAITQRALQADEALEKAEQDYGKLDRMIKIVRVDDERDGRALIVKRPNMTVFRRFQDSGTNETKDLENLVRPCVVWPSKAEFDQLFGEMPFLLRRCADAVCELAGVRREDVSKK